MPISDQQLHHATHYITELCKFRTESFGTNKLSKNDKKHLAEFLFNILVGLKKDQVIIIDPFQKSMKAFRQYLGQNQILFPRGMTITIHRNGETYCNNELIYAYNAVRNKAMQKAKEVVTQEVVTQEVVTQVVESIRRSSSGFLNLSSNTIDAESISRPTSMERPASPTFATIRRSTSDTELSIKRSASSLELQSLTYQYDAYSKSSQADNVPITMATNTDRALPRTTL